MSSDPISAVSFAADGRFIVTGDADGKVKIYTFRPDRVDTEDSRTNKGLTKR